MASKGSSSSSPGPRRSNAGRGSGGTRGAVKTPPRGQRRPEPEKPSVVRQVVNGREVELWGVALVSIALLLALSMYLRFAGPLGRVIDTTFGWLLGLGRYPVPIVVAGIGVTLVRHRSIEHRLRLTGGWTLIAVSVLGVLHLMNGERQIVAEVDAMSKAGGWLGALVCEPLRSTLGWAGALVVLLALAVGGVMLVCDITIPELLARVRGWFNGMLGSADDPTEGVSEDPWGRPQGGTSRRGSAGSIFDVEEDPGLGDPGLRRRGARDGSGEIDGEESRSLDELDDLDDLDDEAASGRSGRAKRERKTADDGGRQPMTPEFVGKKRATKPSEEVEVPPVSITPGNWTLPPLEHLGVTDVYEINRSRVADRGRLLEGCLASHNVEARLIDWTVGPTVTRFELELGPGVKVAKVVNLSRDIAYSMAATDVRILAPIPGKTAVGVEVPNEVRQLVSLGDLVASPEARAATHPLEVAVGKDIAGRAVFLNLASTPHLLIAGATGAGKSSGINSIITSLLMRSTPDQVRLILIDPKQVEMGQYARLPHLLIEPVTNPKKAANALGWAVKEMDRRYDLLVEAGFRDITGYNAAFDRGDLNPPTTEEEQKKKYDRLPFIVVIVDELNDLMMVAARDVEESITRIAQKARAVGIHLVVATQRPSVNVITGVIKANIPARMAFAVSSLMDSRVILDQSGAENLVGKGDMLLLPGNTNVAQRIQGSWVEEEEVRKVVEHWRRQAPSVVYVSGIDEDPGASGGDGLFGGTGSGDDDLLHRAMDIVVRSGLGSTSLLQRKLKVGFARAGRLMDELEERGVVGPSEGSKPRQVLMTVEELDQLGG